MNHLVPGARVEGRVTYHGKDIDERGVDPIAVRTPHRHGSSRSRTPSPKSIYDQ